MRRTREDGLIRRCHARSESRAAKNRKGGGEENGLCAEKEELRARSFHARRKLPQQQEQRRADCDSDHESPNTDFDAVWPLRLAGGPDRSR